MKKKIFAIVLVVLVAVALLPTASAAPSTNPITLVIDGKTVTPTIAPYIDTESNRTLVPMRTIAETLGAVVSWNDSKKQATFETAAYTVVFTINSSNYTVNGVTKTLDNPARNNNSNTMVPLKAFADSIGAEVSWNGMTRTVTVNYFTAMSGDLKMSGSTTVQPIVEAAGAKLEQMNPGKFSYSVVGSGSGSGIKDVAAGTVNIGNSSRELTADELASGLIPNPICNDGIVVIVNPENGITQLTTEQAKDIFLGNIKNWKDVGGADAPIIVNTRESSSGTLSALKELLLENENVVSTATPHASNGLMVQAVASNKYAVGFASMGYVDSTIKGLTLNGIAATTTTVINGTYPLSRQLFCVTKGAATGLAAMFIDYLRTDEAQSSIIAAEGYVKLVD
jgi:phosphate transport system substrate-binding protein